MASKYGLDKVAKKRSTRGICFIGKVDLKDFLSKYTIEKPGDVVDTNGNVIGKHKGVAFYTIGQRKGLSLKVKSIKTQPFYVVEKDAKNNRLVVTDDSTDLSEDYLYCSDLYWIDEQDRDFPLTCEAQIRYNQPPQRATITHDGYIRVQFEKSQRAVAPGQFVVFYNKEELLGSAIIS